MKLLENLTPHTLLQVAWAYMQALDLTLTASTEILLVCTTSCREAIENAMFLYYDSKK